MLKTTYQCLTCGYVTIKPVKDVFRGLRCEDYCCDGPVRQISPKNLDNVQVEAKINS